MLWFHDFWWAELRGGEGVLGSPLEKMIDLMAITLEAVRFPITKAMFHRLLGSWVYVIGFRKEVLAVIECCYSHLYRMPESGRFELPGRVVDELLMLVFLGPLLHVYLKDEPVSFHDAVHGGGNAKGRGAAGRQELDANFATDAAGDGGLGGCIAPVSRESW